MMGLEEDLVYTYLERAHINEVQIHISGAQTIDTQQLSSFPHHQAI